MRKQDDFVSSIFTREKRDGSYRMILNLKQPNKHTEYEHFKMEHHTKCFDCYSTELLHGQCEFERCILYSANPSRPLKLSQIKIKKAMLCI